MPSEITELLEFNQYSKFDKAAFIIYADLEFLIEKIDRCENNFKKSSTTKLSENALPSFSMSTISSFRRRRKKNHDLYKGKECMKKYLKKFLQFFIMDLAMITLYLLRRKH